MLLLHFHLTDHNLLEKEEGQTPSLMEAAFRIDISIRLHAAFMNFQITLQYNGKSGWGAAISPCLVGHKRLKRLTKHTNPILKLLKFNDTSSWVGMVIRPTSCKRLTKQFPTTCS